MPDSAIDRAEATVTRADIAARIDRLPVSRGLVTLVALIAFGGWFEFYELFLPGGIALGITKSVFTAGNKGLVAWNSYPTFLAAFFFGMFVGTALFSWTSDRFGRVTIFATSMIVYSVALFASALLSSPVLIDALRFVAGLGVSIQLINNDAYLSEITPKAARGRLMAFALTVILTAEPIGALLAYLLVPHTIFAVEGWRWVMILGSLGGIAVLFVRRGLPESPRWLAAHGRPQEALAVLARLEARIEADLGHPLPAPSPVIARSAAEPKGQWREIFAAPFIGRTVMLSLFQFCQTIAVFGFLNWLPVMLVKSGHTVVHSLLYTVVTLLLVPVGGLLGMCFADRFERKWQLVGTALGIGVFGVAFSHAASVPMLLLLGGLMTLCSNWLIAIFHPYAAELYPTRIRAQAIGFTFCWSRVSSIGVGYAVALLLDTYGQIGVFTLIAAAMAVIVLAVGILGPRTNGRTLEAIAP